MNPGIKLNQIISSEDSDIIGIYPDDKIPEMIEEIGRFYYFNFNGMNIFYHSDLECEKDLSGMIDPESAKSFIDNYILFKYEELKEMIDSERFYFIDPNDEFSICDNQLDSLESWIESRENLLFDSLSQLEYLIDQLRLI